MFVSAVMNGNTETFNMLVELGYKPHGDITYVFGRAVKLNRHDILDIMIESKLLPRTKYDIQSWYITAHHTKGPEAQKSKALVRKAWISKGWPVSELKTDYE